MIDYNKVFIDTAPFIYFIEKDSNNPQYYEKVKSFFQKGYETDKRFITSVITMEEYFVFPYRNNTLSFIDMFNRLVDTMDMEIIEINQQIAKKAAQIRAEYMGFKAMDALQLAVACSSGCDLFLTNDKQLRQFKEIRCITVDELFEE
jgi:predicted nucleic acid-binding protein